MESNQHIREALERLAAARQAEKIAAAEWRILSEQFEAAHMTASRAVTTTVNARETAESEARELILAHHAATGETRPSPGAEIVMRATYDVDEVAGLEWARLTRMALVPESLNRLATIAIAKATPLPFVTETKVPSVRIAPNLDAALAAVMV